MLTTYWYHLTQNQSLRVRMKMMMMVMVRMMMMGGTTPGIAQHGPLIMQVSLQMATDCSRQITTTRERRRQEQ